MSVKLWDKLMHSDNVVFTFLRSIVASQAASWVDLIMGFLLFTFAGFDAFWSTASGAIAGGILNCIINYRFTFHASGISYKAVGVKYVMVWIGSVMLNAFGTDLLYGLLSVWHWFDAFGMDDSAAYAAARLLASLIVSLGWNFLLQRRFVYRETSFDKKCIRFVDFFLPARLRSSSTK